MKSINGENMGNIKKVSSEKLHCCICITGGKGSDDILNTYLSRTAPFCSLRVIDVTN